MKELAIYAGLLGGVVWLLCKAQNMTIEASNKPSEYYYLPNWTDKNRWEG